MSPSRAFLPLTALFLGLSFTTTALAAEREASSSGKGISGGALLGAEIVLLTEAAFKVQPTWAYVIGGVVGAGGGGLGGYFLESSSSDARVPTFMLAGGMALAIPTIVAVLSATAYQPPAEYVQDRAPLEEPVAEPPRPATQPGPAVPLGKKPERRRVAAFSQPMPTPSTAFLPPSLLSGNVEHLTLAMPSVEIANLYSRKERAMYGLPDAKEFRVSLVGIQF